MVLCMKQHNGQYACPYCYNPGVTIGSDHLHRYWPIKHDAIARIDARLVSDVTEAVDLRHPVRLTLFINNMYVLYSYNFILMQVKGMLNVVFPLLALPGFDVVEGTVIDWMHVICLGITRLLLDRWLTFSDEIYFTGDKENTYIYVYTNCKLCHVRVLILCREFFSISVSFQLKHLTTLVEFHIC